MGVAISSFMVFAASQVATPGPANLVLLTTGARYGLEPALPFVCGVVLGKQLIIWPLGFGLLQVAQSAPVIFGALKWICAAYILWLAWRVAHIRLGSQGTETGKAPGFLAGLAVHPLNPKAWAMVVAGFTSFTAVGTPPLQATIAISLILFACQVILHPLWTLGGARLAVSLAGTPGERYLMWALAGLTVLSLFFALFWGGRA